MHELEKRDSFCLEHDHVLIITEDPIGLDNHHELPEGDNSISFSKNK